MRLCCSNKIIRLADSTLYRAVPAKFPASMVIVHHAVTLRTLGIAIYQLHHGR